MWAGEGRGSCDSICDSIVISGMRCSGHGGSGGDEVTDDVVKVSDADALLHSGRDADRGRNGSEDVGGGRFGIRALLSEMGGCVKGSNGGMDQLIDIVRRKRGCRDATRGRRPVDVDVCRRGQWVVGCGGNAGGFMELGHGTVMGERQMTESVATADGDRGEAKVWAVEIRRDKRGKAAGRGGVVVESSDGGIGEIER